jgi:hypothetical protein
LRLTFVVTDVSGQGIHSIIEGQDIKEEFLDIRGQDVKEDFLEIFILKEGKDTLYGTVSNKGIYAEQQTRRAKISYFCMINYSTSSYSLQTPALNVKP